MMFILKLCFYHYLSCVNIVFYSYINNIDFNVFLSSNVSYFIYFGSMIIFLNIN
jgi:hypothetical protein